MVEYCKGAARRSDPRSPGGIGRCRCFNPRSHAGSDRRRLRSGLLFVCFNPCSHAGSDLAGAIRQPSVVAGNSRSDEPANRVLLGRDDGACSRVIDPASISSQPRLERRRVLAKVVQQAGGAARIGGGELTRAPGGGVLPDACQVVAQRVPARLRHLWMRMREPLRHQLLT